MVEVWLAYGRTEVPIRVPEENLLGIASPKLEEALPDSVTEVDELFRKRARAEGLWRVGPERCNLAVVVGCQPQDLITPRILSVVLQEAGASGIDDARTTVIVARGESQPVGRPSVRDYVGDEIASRYKCLVHDAGQQDCVRIGRTRRGTEVEVNRAFADATIRIVVAQTRLDGVIGYYGGPDCIVPGIASPRTTAQCFALALQKSRKEIDPEILRSEMGEAARLADVGLLLSLVPTARSGLAKAFAGKIDRAFEESCQHIEKAYKFGLQRRADIAVISAGGYLYDGTLFDATRVLLTVERILKDEGVAVLVAECRGGYGDSLFYRWITDVREGRELEGRLRRKFNFGGYVALLLSRFLEKHRVYLVSTMSDYHVSSRLGMRPAKTANSALQLAYRAAGRGSSVAVIPHGFLTPLTVDQSQLEKAVSH